jgi:hypothetical protein
MPKVRDMLPHPDTARQVAGDALADMPVDEREFLADEADLLIHAYRNGADMPAVFANRHYDTEEKLALWFLLPSYVRSAIKNARR